MKRMKLVIMIVAMLAILPIGSSIQANEVDTKYPVSPDMYDSLGYGYKLNSTGGVHTATMTERPDGDHVIPVGHSFNTVTSGGITYDVTVIALAGIEGFQNQVLDSVKFDNVVKFDHWNEHPNPGSHAYVFHGTTLKNMNFPELVEISGTNGGLAFREANLTNVSFPKLKTIDTGYFGYATLNNVSLPVLYHSDVDTHEAFIYAILDEKTVIGMKDFGRQTGMFEYATLNGTQFPNLTETGSKSIRSFSYATINNVDFNKLKTVNGSNSFTGSTFIGDSFPVLETINAGASSFNSSYGAFQNSKFTDGELSLPKLKKITGSNHFKNVPSLKTLHVPSVLPVVTEQNNFKNGDLNKYIRTIDPNHLSLYAEDDQDGNSKDQFWYEFNIDTYLIFDSMGGTAVEKQLSNKVTNKVATPVAPTKENFLFDGWY